MLLMLTSPSSCVGSVNSRIASHSRLYSMPVRGYDFLYTAFDSRVVAASIERVNGADDREPECGPALINGCRTFTEYL